MLISRFRRLVAVPTVPTRVWLVTLVSAVVLFLVPSVAGAVQITDLGVNAYPRAVNAQGQVALSNGLMTGLWADGTFTVPKAPSADSGAEFSVTGYSPGTALNDDGVLVGATGNGNGVPTYWNSGHSSRFVEVSLAGLKVDGQPATSGYFTGVDAAGEAVGVVFNGAFDSDGNFESAGLFDPASHGLPSAKPQVISSVDGIAIESLDGISATYESANDVDSREVLINRKAKTATTTNIEASEGLQIGFGDTGWLSGVTPGPAGCSCDRSTVRAPGGTESQDTVQGDLVEDVNGEGESVGYDTSNGNGLSWDLIWNPTPLLSTVSNPAGWSGLIPNAVNDQGDIVGTGYLNGAQHGFLIAAAPQLSAAPVTVDTYLEQSGQDATFTLKLSSPSSTPVTVHYETQDGTGDDAAKADEGDYQPVSGTLTFPPGKTVEKVKVHCYADITLRKDSAFDLVLTDLNGASFKATDSSDIRRAFDETTPTELKVKATVDPNLKVGTITRIKLLNARYQWELESVRYDSNKNITLHVGDSLYVGDSIDIGHVGNVRMMLSGLIRFTETNRTVHYVRDDDSYRYSRRYGGQIARILKQEITVSSDVHYHRVNLLRITIDGGVMGITSDTGVVGTTS